MMEMKMENSTAVIFCHCHGCSPSPNLPVGLPPADFSADNATQCWAKCDSYRSLCGQ